MGRKGWGRLGAGLAAALGLAGCATGSGAYTEPEQARIDAYERAAEQILQSRGMKGPAPAVRVGTDPSLAGAGRPAGYYTDQGRRIVVNRAAVADDYIAQAVLSQELAHYVLGHMDTACRERRLECEIEARIASVELLMTGWGLEYADAIRLRPRPGRATPAGSSRSSRRGSRLRLRASRPAVYRNLSTGTGSWIAGASNSLGLTPLSLLDYNPQNRPMAAQGELWSHEGLR